MAGVPDPTQSSAEAVVVGTNKGTQALGGPGGFGTSAVPGYEVVVKDAGGTPLAGVTVTIDFHDALPGLGGGHEDSVVVYTSQVDGSTSCGSGGNSLARITDANGLALFQFPRFGGYVYGARIPVRANTVLIRNIEARSVDSNNDGITNILDQAIFSQDKAGAFTPAKRRSDYNLSNTVDILDQAIFASDKAGSVLQTQCAGH
jgi:hypothetical protein